MPTSWVPRGAKVDPKWVQSVRASGFLARPRAPSDGAPTPRGWACHPEITLLQPSALPLVRAFLGYGITNTYCIGSTRHVFEDIYVPCVTIFVYIHTTLPVLVYSSGSGFDGTALARFLLVLSMARWQNSILHKRNQDGKRSPVSFSAYQNYLCELRVKYRNLP
jgi:hypothetical protein